MQASKITIGEQYAYPHDGEDRALVVTEIIQRKTATKTYSQVKGFYVVYEEASERRVMVDDVDVADIVGDYQKVAEQKAEAARVAAARKAKTDAETARRNHAIDLLAAAIGAQNVHEKYASYGEKATFREWDQNAPAVIGNYGEVVVNPQAIEKLIAFFERVNVVADLNPDGTSFSLKQIIRD